MRRAVFFPIVLLLLAPAAFAQAPAGQVADRAAYLREVAAAMNQAWPRNHIINIVCHGHSVPAGYFQTPVVDTFNAYPHLLHKGLKEKHPRAVINVIVTAIGGEQSESGAAHFDRDVLAHRPAVVTIDYALNDRGIGLDRARKAWSSMIEKAQKAGAKVILLTPTPDARVPLDKADDPLYQHAKQVRELAAQYNVGLVDSLAAFQQAVKGGAKLEDLMSMYVHPNRKGHDLVAAELLKWFALEKPAAPTPTPTPSPSAAADATGIDPATIEQWSAKFLGWHYYPDHVIPSQPKIAGFEKFHSTDVPTVFQLPGDEKWYMTFIAFDGRGYQSFLAVSDDLVHWRHKGLAMGFGPHGEFDYGGVVLGAYLYESYDLDARRTLKRHQGKYWSLYGAYPRQGGYELRPGYEGLAASDDGLTWTRAKKEPILSVHQADCGRWEKDCIYQPWLVEDAGKYFNFYNAANGGTEQMGLAASADLLNWTRHPANPVVRNRRGGYDEQFCSDGKVFRDGDHWVMFYFGVGRGGAHIMAAFSRDLVHWTARAEPLYKAGGHPGGLDKTYAHKISLVRNPANDTYYLFYDAVGKKGRGIGLITSKPLKAE